MDDSPIQRFLAWAAHIGLDYPRRVLLVVLLAVGVSAALLPGIRVSTSRYGLVSPDNPYQARLLDFFERFGSPDTPVFVVTGGDEAARRGAVDRLEQELDTIEALRGRVLARVRPRDVAEVLLLQDPTALAAAAAALPPGASLAEVVEGGLPAYVRAMEAGVYAGLEGDAPAAAQAQADAGLGAMAQVARAFDRYLQGGDPLEGVDLTRFIPAGQGLDGQGYLATADGEALVVLTFPELAGDDVNRDLRPIVETLAAARDRARADLPAEVKVQMTGLPPLAVDELNYISQGLFVSSGLAAAGIFLFCLALFRSFRQAVVSLLPLGVGVLLTMGAVRLLYGELNLITSSVAAVLLGLGIDFAVHLVSRANEAVRAGASPREGARVALLRTGGGIAVGTVTTALAFLTTTTTEFTAYGELGVITAVGLLLIMLATFFMLPPLLLLTRAGEHAAPELPGLALLARTLRRAPRAVLVVAVLTAVAGAAAFPRVGFNSRYFDFLPPDVESSQALDRLEGDPLMSPVIANLVADSVEDARAKAAQARALPSVAGVQSGSDLLPPLDEARLAALRSVVSGIPRPPDFQALTARRTDPSQLAGAVTGLADAIDEARFALEQAGRPVQAATDARGALQELARTLKSATPQVTERLHAFEADVGDVVRRAWTTAAEVGRRGGYLPTDLPPLFRRRFVSKDGKQMAIYVVPAGDIWSNDVAKVFVADMERIDPRASGLALNRYIHEIMVVEGFRRATVIAAVLIFLVLLLDFRSLRDTLLAMVPTAVGWAWMIGGMAALHLRFDPANVVSLPLVLGIGIAYGVHLVHRARNERAAAGGQAPELDVVVRGTGGAVIIAALTTITGFAALMVVDYGAMKNFGLVMVLGIGACLVASLLVLPAWMLLSHSAR